MFAVIMLCLFIGLAGFVAYLLLGSVNVEKADEADIFGGDTGGGGGGGGSPSPRLPPTTPRAAGRAPDGTPPDVPTPELPPPDVPPRAAPPPGVPPRPAPHPAVPLRPAPPPARPPPAPMPPPKKPFSVNELVCTVGAYAIFPSMIPTEGLCTYIYYRDVAIARGTLHGVLVPESWATFQNEMQSRSRPLGGIGFDIRSK
ncbi:uncharacterized protein [Dermacentor albipictus]|uniref:uncharacterized protein isoform X2 n=1 Tax=Dermacentor albipictus TaxID=60249 RepID=UPI0038FCE388